jgi:hypothetical protein
MKDLVISPAKKYQDIFDTISNTNMNANSHRNKYLPSINANEYNNVDTDYTDINLLPTENTNYFSSSLSSSSSSSNDMKDELKSFLKKQLNSSDQELGSAF